MQPGATSGVMTREELAAFLGQNRLAINPN
jgi:hypothetical protein